MDAEKQPVVNESQDDELHQLRAEVERLRSSLAAADGPGEALKSTSFLQSVDLPSSSSSSHSHSPLHALLLLADTALPLGAFAYSAGLESYLAHHQYAQKQIQTRSAGHNHRAQHSTSAKHLFEAKHGPSAKHFPTSPSKAPPPTTKSELLNSFLFQSLSTCTRASLPFVFAAFDDPSKLFELDDMYDASISCLVARRQSIETGRALLGAWMKGLGFVNVSHHQQSPSQGDVHRMLLNLDATLKTTSARQTSDADPPLHHGHVAPLWGAVSRAAGVTKHDAAYVFLLNHVRGLLSAAVRAGVLGPFKQLAMLADSEIRSWIEQGVRQAQQLVSSHGVQAAGQVVPLNDIWGGRHELLYSRVFNS